MSLTSSRNEVYEVTGMNGEELADELIKVLVPKGMDDESKETMKKAWTKISNAIVQYIQKKAVVHVTIDLGVQVDADGIYVTNVELVSPNLSVPIEELEEGETPSPLRVITAKGSIQ